MIMCKFYLRIMVDKYFYCEFVDIYTVNENVKILVNKMKNSINYERSHCINCKG